MPANQTMTVLGKITTAFGIKGWLKVYSYTDPAANIFDYSNWFIKVNNDWKPFEVREGKPQGKGLVVALEGIGDRNAAMALSQCEIAIPTEQLPKLEEDEFYWFQLEGLQVVNQQEQRLGCVDSVFDSGGHNIVIKVRPDSKSVDEQERLIPYVDAYVLNTDLESNTLHVDWEADY